MTSRKKATTFSSRSQVTRLGSAFWYVALVAMFIGIAWTPTHAVAKDKRVFWRLVQENTSADLVADLESALKGVLVQAEDEHILTQAQLGNSISTRPLRVPQCFEGTKTCGEIEEALVELLQVHGVVRAEISAVTPYTLRLTYFRDYGGQPKVVEKTGADITELARDAVSELFTLEAALTIVSTPNGAKAFLNGRYVGDTPQQVFVGEGLHTLRFEHEGYLSHRGEITLLPGDQSTYEGTLEAERTQVTILSKAENAEVYIDDTFLGMANEPIDVQPGKHLARLSAKGYRDIELTFDIGAADERTLWLAMLPEVEDPWVRRERGIYAHRLWAEASFATSFQSGTFSDMSGTLVDEKADLRGYNTGSEASLFFQGVSLGFGYTWRNFGLELIHIDLGVAGAPDVATVGRNAQTFAAAGDSMTHVGILPLQATTRWAFGPFGVNGSLGLGVGFDSMTMTVDDPMLQGEHSINFASTNMLAAAHISGRYYFGQEWYASIGYKLDVDFASDRGVRNQLMLGFGMHLPWLVDDGLDGEQGTDPVELEEMDEVQSDPPIEDESPDEAPIPVEDAEEEEAP